MSSEVVQRSRNSFDLFPQFWEEDTEYSGPSESTPSYDSASRTAPQLNGTDNELFEPVESLKKGRFQLAGLASSYDLEFIKRIQESKDEHEKIDLSQMKGTINGFLTDDINLKSGTLVYSSSYRATQPNLLTPIEKTLDLCIIRSIQSGNHWPKEYAWFLQTMPQSIPDLIDFMFAERVLPLSREDAETLKNAYKLGEFYCKEGRSIHGATNKPAKLILKPDDAQRLRDAYTRTYGILLKLITPPKDAEVR